MKGSRAGAPPTDLLVCFPSRSHLALAHRPINSPSRPNHRSQSSPLFRAPNKNSRPDRSRTQLGSDIGSEPTSPKVTCAGQIKVRHRHHHHHKNLAGPRRPGQKNWVEALGIKKDVMNFLGALRSLRPSMRCFGSFSGAVDCCSDEEEEDGEEEEIGGGSQSRSVFSKWLMVLEEENREETKNEELIEEEKEEEEEEEIELPPKNALLLMRCRSAPAKGREEEKAEDKEEEEEERLMLMSYAPDFFKLSTEIAKETWVVGSVDPLMVRSRSWRR